MVNGSKWTLGLQVHTEKGTADRMYELLLNTNTKQSAEFQFDVTTERFDVSRTERRKNARAMKPTNIATSEFKTRHFTRENDWATMTNIRSNLVGSSKHLVVKIVLK